MNAVDPFPLVYDELRRIAVARLRTEPAGQSLNATALVHEAYLRMAGQDGFDNKAHFFAAAAEAMRRILVEAARRRQAIKRGGAVHREFVGDTIAAPEPDDELLAMNESLDRFAAEHAEKAEVVKLRYFAGLTADEAAAALGISPSTGDRHWNYARAWLKRDMTRGDLPGS